MKYKVYKVLNPSTTADKVPVDFKLDNVMLRGAMRIFKFSWRELLDFQKLSTGLDH